MNEQRFRILETRALYEIGLPTFVLWGTLLLQLLGGSASGGGWRLSLPGLGINLLVYNVILALGFSCVWLMALQWTQTEVIVSPKSLSLVVLGQTRWSLTWQQLAVWTWDFHWTGIAQGLRLVCKDGTARDLRLGFLGLGRPVKGLVQVYPYYVPLMKALGYYLMGEQWREPTLPGAKPGKGGKSGWF